MINLLLFLFSFGTTKDILFLFYFHFKVCPIGGVRGGSYTLVKCNNVKTCVRDILFLINRLTLSVFVFFLWLWCRLSDHLLSSKPDVFLLTESLSNPAARSLAAASLPDDASSQHSSDQSDTRTEHSDEDAADRAPKRSTTAKATKKPAAPKTEVR